MMIPKEKRGYLDIKLPSKLKSLKWKVWHHRWVVLHQLTNMAATNKPIVRLTFFSKHQVDPSATNLNNSNNDDTTSIASFNSTNNNFNLKGGSRSHSIYLENITAVSRVKSRTRKYAFAVMVGGTGTGSGTSSSLSETALLLAGSSESETQTWMAALRDAALPPPPPGFFDFPMMLDIGEVYQDAYIIDGESSLKLALSGHYLLAVSQNALGLYSPLDGHLCHEWRFNHLSSYGVSQRGVVTEDTNRIFNIVANRSCPSGEGNFSFFLPDAQEVLSQITTSMQRTVSRNTIDHFKDVQTNSNNYPKDQHARSLNNAKQNGQENAHCVSRASSCRLPLRTTDVVSGDDNIGEEQVDDVHHQRQGSLTCDVECVAFRDNSYCNMEDLRIREDTKSSYSDDNSRRCNLGRHKTGILGAGEHTKCLDLNQNITKEEDVQCSTTAEVHNNPAGDKPSTSTPESNNNKQKLLSVSPGLSAIVSGDSSFLLNTTSYFRRPSWYSDTTNADVESTTSSEDYRELCRSAGSGSGCVLLRRTPGRSLPQTAVHQPMPSGHRQRSVSNAASHTSGSFCTWANTEGDIEALHRVCLGDDRLSESMTSSSNEADDEVELGEESDGGRQVTVGGKDDVIRGECERRALRKSSAVFHLYQELPDVKHCCDDRSHCQVCYRRPPELPPRCDMQSPAQSDTSAISRQEQADFLSKGNSMCCPHDKKYDSTGSTILWRTRSVSENPPMSKQKHPGHEAEAISSKDLGENNRESIPKPMTASPELATKVGVDGVTVHENSASKKQIDDQNNVPGVINDEVDPMRKISILSGLYQDIDSLSEGGDADFDTVTDTPPEPPPRNRKSKHTDGQEFYEDLDRFRKNIHKYLGISISDVNPPPPLPQRPVSLPSVRQRTKSKLRSLGRKKKATSTGSGAEAHVSPSQTTDNNSSLDLGVGISRVSAWPFRFGSSVSHSGSRSVPTSMHNVPPLSSSSSLVTDNNFYTLRNAQFGKEAVADAHAGSDYYGRRSLLMSEQQNQYASFSCHSCGVMNHLYANTMTPLPPQPYVVSSRAYLQPQPTPVSPASIVQHRRYVSTPVDIPSRSSTTSKLHQTHHHHHHHHQEVVPNPFHELMPPHLAPWSGCNERRASDLHSEDKQLNIQQGPPPLYTNSSPAGPLSSMSYNRWSAESATFSDMPCHQWRSACGADRESTASSSAMPPAEVLEELQRDLLEEETPGDTPGSANSDIYTDMSGVGEEAMYLPMLTMEDNINEPRVAEPVYINWPLGEMTESRAFALVNCQRI